MAIVKLAKVTLFGIADQKESVLEDLQGFGCLHLINLSPGTGEGLPETGSAEAHEAVQYLASCTTQRRQVTDPAEFDFSRVEREVLETRHRERVCRDERDYLVEAIEAQRPWGEFETPPNGVVGDLRLWFYTVPHYEMAAVRESSFVWQAVARDTRFEYVVVLSEEEPEGFPGTQQTLDPRPLSQLRRRLRELDDALEDLHWRRVDLTRWHELLIQALTEADDRAIREYAATQTLDASQVFAVQGWIPREQVSRLEGYAFEHGMAVTVAEPATSDQPPTLLENPEYFRGGEQTVTFFMTPGYRAWDPSIVLFISFCLFFAMIFADAGYGALLGLIVAAVWKKMETTRALRRMRTLFTALACSSIVYGILAGSYFGLAPPPGSPLAAVRILNPVEQGQMIRLSILIGGIHVVLANLVAAWVQRRSIVALASVGWAVAITGALAAGFRAIGDEVPVEALTAEFALAGGGLLGVFLFSSTRPLSSLLALLARIGDGLVALFKVTGAFGDVLSYLRLFALGLASSSLAITFNELAHDLATGLPGMGILLAVLILLVGHAVNFVLAILSGVVHGLRLNYIEFFNWSLSEEGYPFHAFCKKAGP